jgi:cobaltochelatase CobN
VLFRSLDVNDAQALGVTLAKARGELLPAPTANTVGQHATPPAAATNAPAAAPEAVPQAKPETPPVARYYELQPVATTPSLGDRLLHILGLLAATLALFTLGLWRGLNAPRLSSGETHV